MHLGATTVIGLERSLAHKSISRKTDVACPTKGHKTKGCTHGINRLNLRGHRACVKPSDVNHAIMVRNLLIWNERHARMKKIELLIFTAFANVYKSYPQPVHACNKEFSRGPHTFRWITFIQI
ncbi:hypothetical protein FB555_001433 [Alpinimonas psychrophila]|uniref:Uncharacterized protein n=1 Tax=Alpinimonas psychrophila TaxID=748908 RepID=A0A7W3JU97_9MICO|nr:hypothetical protein [Alpinimonas psychrophila]